MVAYLAAAGIRIFLAPYRSSASLAVSLAAVSLAAVSPVVSGRVFAGVSPSVEPAAAPGLGFHPGWPRSAHCAGVT